MINSLIGFISFALMITIVVGWHELGHYLAARILKVKVTEFQIGFGPKLFGFKDKNGTMWSLRSIPLGGGVELPEIESISPLKKFITLFAGPFFSLMPLLIVEIVLAINGMPSLTVKLFNLIASQGIHLKDFGSIISMYSFTSKVTQGSTGMLFLAKFIKLTFLLSVDVGIMNLLPIPPLDGGRMILSILEAFASKMIYKATERALIFIGVFLLGVMFVIAIYNDIVRLLN